VDASVETENMAGICRITCGWKKPELSLDTVCRYWRDVHSPGIARRPGVWEYRHFQYAPVQADAFAPLPGVEQACPADQQLMWQSDVRYRDEAALAAFAAVPEPAVLRQLLGDIDLIVDQSTTYKVLGTNGRTHVDANRPLVPQGPVTQPTYGVFFRRRGDDEAGFRAALQALAGAWAADAAVSRLRLSLFETPDMEAERRSGYPIKTHPVERQYQALIDLGLRPGASARALTALPEALAAAPLLSAVHAYPVKVVYTSVYGGRPTLVGLRGYPAFEAMNALGAVNQRDVPLLRWMYGASVVQEGPVA
jgi:hypothetical protein